MMFDPPDYPFKELSETYDLLFNNDSENSGQQSSSNINVTDTLLTVNSVENQLAFNSNDSGRFFNVDNSSLFQDNTPTVQNTELYIVQSDNLFNFEPLLLDENTVNQFLLPLQDVADKPKV
ncbi:unnamed protein product [Arctia plantaginis]|uniref:Uncharacterized protein n=1 Tax=Arctia plantaginis TaxID=874455 RepID=A0A8S1AGS7_ARCPL|nr:unnamed protein product [Arctia plantaginis]